MRRWLHSWDADGHTGARHYIEAYGGQWTCRQCGWFIWRAP